MSQGLRGVKAGKFQGEGDEEFFVLGLKDTLCHFSAGGNFPLFFAFLDLLQVHFPQHLGMMATPWPCNGGDARAPPGWVGLPLAQLLHLSQAGWGDSHG